MLTFDDCAQQTTLYLSCDGSFGNIRFGVTNPEIFHDPGFVSE